MRKFPAELLFRTVEVSASSSPTLEPPDGEVVDRKKTMFIDLRFPVSTAIVHDSEVREVLEFPSKIDESAFT